MTCVHINRSQPKPMRDRRETSRAEARRRRKLAASDLTNKVRAVHEQVASTVNKTRRVLADKTFRVLLHSQGVRTVPRHLVDSRQRSTRFPGGNIKSAKDRLDEVSLQFVVAWTFIFPLLSNPEAVKFLEKAYPGFVLEMKDTFISLVTEGPFPCALSDFRGRRHRALYHVVKRRTPAVSKPTNSGLPMQTN